MEDCPDSQIKVDLKDSIIKEALNTGMDLRQYSLQIEQQLQEVVLNKLYFFFSRLVNMYFYGFKQLNRWNLHLLKTMSIRAPHWHSFMCSSPNVIMLLQEWRIC